MRSLIVVPTYNELENLESVVLAVLGVTRDETEILIVDDNSPDGTGKLADRLSAQFPRVHVLHRAGKQGLGTAYVAGFHWGLAQGGLAQGGLAQGGLAQGGEPSSGAQAYDVLIEMDADFSHDPKYLPMMLEKLASFDVAIGSRYVPGGGTVNWGLGRRLLSRGGSLYSRLILGASIRDFTGGFNGWRRQVLESVDLHSLRSDGYSFQIELKYRAFRLGFRMTEFPIVFADRQIGKSKMNRKIIFEALLRVWGFRFSRLS